MNVHSISQAILISEDLLAQYRRVAARLDEISGAHMQQAHEGAHADTFSLLIGQANQLYTGIWEHLDVAAAELAAAGRGVQQYQQMRVEHGHLGVLDSTSQTALALGPSVIAGKVTTQTKLAAKTNQHGADQAEHMCEVLKAKLPDFDWAAARRAADAPPEDLSTKTHTYFIAALVVGLIAFVAYIVVS